MGFYKHHYRNHKEIAENLKSIKDFRKLPTTSKGVFFDYFQGPNFDFGINNIVYFDTTSGTSNMMAIYYFNKNDYQAFKKVAEKIVEDEKSKSHNNLASSLQKLINSFDENNSPLTNYSNAAAIILAVLLK